MRNKNTPPVSTRLSIQESLYLDEIVEERGSSRSEALRHCFNEYRKQHSIEQRLIEQERRLSKVMFAITSFGLQLSQDERKQMAKQLREIGVKW
ncbi:MAG: metal-responsive CopG/Arc/MetJ family transcriptional regulator [Paraglaciecola sp.]|jgi:metal-responsive CopG/Arc/MetJ family transcriptional regulator